MRTTLTLDDDLAGILQKKAIEEGRPFKAVVNSLLRAGIEASEGPSPLRESVKVTGRPLGLRPGFDPDKLNQLADELEGEDFLKRDSER
ncbi:MAG: hypothetical protein ABL994_15800 [Verrucomicrobiales bacterium]